MTDIPEGYRAFLETDGYIGLSGPFYGPRPSSGYLSHASEPPFTSSAPARSRCSEE